MTVDWSGNLYVGGDFTGIGTVLANRIAKWNGSTWSAFGSGMNDQSVRERSLCRGILHQGERDEHELHRQMERQHLVGPQLGDE